MLEVAFITRLMTLLRQLNKILMYYTKIHIFLFYLFNDKNGFNGWLPEVLKF